MRNIKLTLAYDGSEFHGWQIQPGQPTIQGILTDVIERLTRCRVLVHGAGRTDAGVHATGQVANFQTESNMSSAEFQRAINALLPAAIRVVAADEVALDFHARWGALAKTYRYTIFRGRVAPPFLWRYIHHDFSPMNFEAMTEAARQFVGEHDFTSFAASTGSGEDDRELNVVRTIYHSELLHSAVEGSHERAENWAYVVSGRSFLRYMVRKMVGTLVDVGHGKLKPEDISAVFACRDRSKSGPTMPPQGLCLEEVEYGDPFIAAPPHLSC
jgi:tRNA pseudouridine38-40 synthase